MLGCFGKWKNPGERIQRKVSYPDITTPKCGYRDWKNEGYSGSAGLSGKLVYSDESYLVVRNGRITGGRIKKSDGTWEELKNGTN